jgi:outer membrane receptor protein involved in Fe transport
MTYAQKILLSTSALSGAVLLAAPAWAQVAAVPAQPPAATAQQRTDADPGAVRDADDADATVSEIVVTGSRIRRTDLTSAQPIQIISTERIDQKGQTNVADALNELPISGIATNLVGDQGSFSTGRQFVNIFNLGTQRTLVLVNGRRFVGGNAASLFVAGNATGSQVDLNVIPTALVDRIETIQAGGSAVYGSDAIAGVINIITKTEFDGVEVNGEYGLSEQGDAENYRARITAGQNFFEDRFNIAGSYEYNKTEALAFTDRDVTARQIAFAANPLNTSGTDGIPGNILIENRRIPETNTGGIPFRTSGSALSNILTVVNAAGQRVPAQFAPNGDLVPYDTGTFYQPSIASRGNGLNLAELSSLISPNERHVATLFSRFDITPNLRLSGELFFNNTKASEPFNQPIYNAPIFGGASSSLQFSTANPLLSAQARAALLAQPTALPADPANPGERLFFLSRASTDIGDNETSSESDTIRGVLNLEGDFEALGRNFFWNVAANYGQSDGAFQSPNIVQTRFLEAIDVIRDASGNAVCRSATARAAGCAPLSLFGLGAPSEAALDYVQVQFESEFEIKQTAYEANFGGDLFNLPAGPVSFNVGYEYRKEESSFTPNTPQRTGVGRSAAISAISGEFDTSEYYVEGLLPIFGEGFNFLGARRLEVDGAFRSIDNSQTGKDESWQVGVRWYPVDDLLLRYSKSRAFRSPSIVELFLPEATSFVSSTPANGGDPCDRNNLNSGPNPAARLANCRAAFQALGLPADFQLTSLIQAATVQGRTAGNQDLLNEIADQYSVGMVYQPSFAPGLSLSVDLVDIELSDGIFNFALPSILQVCYDSPTPPADACGRFRRGNSALPAAQQGQILGAGAVPGELGPLTGFVNAGYINFRGLTYGVNYELDLADLPATQNLWGGNPGELGFDLDLFTVEQQETSVTGLGFDLNDDRNEIGNADFRWKLDTSYVRDPLSVLWTTRYIGQSRFNADFTPETRIPLEVDDYFLNDVSFTYDLASLIGGGRLDSLDARLVVRNVFDEEAPYGTTGLGVYDVIGRYYQVGLTARF